MIPTNILIERQKLIIAIMIIVIKNRGLYEDPKVIMTVPTTIFQIIYFII